MKSENVSTSSPWPSASLKDSHGPEASVGAARSLAMHGKSLTKSCGYKRKHVCESQERERERERESQKRERERERERVKTGKERERETIKWREEKNWDIVRRSKQP
jgi:hypothetical protein